MGHFLVATIFSVIIRALDAISESKTKLFAATQETRLNRPYLHLHPRPWRIADENRIPSSPSRDSQVQVLAAGSVAVAPLLWHPLFAQFLTTGQTAEDEETVVPVSSSELEKLLQHFQKIGEASPAQMMVPELENTRRVPTRPVNASVNGAVVNQSIVETHDQGIMANHNNSALDHQLNTSSNFAFVEYLPTITTAFFDSITHTIVGEIQQHVQLIKPGIIDFFPNFVIIGKANYYLGAWVVGREGNDCHQATLANISHVKVKGHCVSMAQFFS